MINKEMDDLEQDVKIIMVDGEYKTIREVLNNIFTKDKKKKRFSEG